MSSGVDPYGGILSPTIAQAKAIQRATGKPFFAALHEARGTAPDAAAVRQAEELYRQGVAEIDAKRAAERRAVSTKGAVDRAQRIMAAEPSVNFHEAMDRARGEAKVSALDPGGVADRAQRLRAANPRMSHHDSMTAARNEITIERLKAEAKKAR